MDHSTISWTDATWNVVEGCTRVSRGCEHCYAETMAARFSGPGLPYHGLAIRTPDGPRWTGKVRFRHDRLGLPLKWKAPRRIFVNSMSDLFHNEVADEDIGAAFGIMALAQRHKFQILTKRPTRMRVFFDGVSELQERCMVHRAITQAQLQLGKETSWCDAAFGRWPPPNVWLGVSVEDQRSLERIEILSQTPAAIRFVSFEPLLEDLGLLDLSGIDWAIIGGESGAGARVLDCAWVRSIIDQCRHWGVAVFVKQLGSNAIEEKGASLPIVRGKREDPEFWNPNLRWRQFPRERPRSVLRAD